MGGASGTSDALWPVHVLALIKGLGVGGAEQLLLSAARVADHRRFAFHVAYVRPDKDALVEPLRAAGVHVLPLDEQGLGPRAWIPRLRSLVASGDFDVVHAHSPLLAGVARLAVRRLPAGQRALMMTTEHNTWDSFAGATRLFNAVTTPLDDHRWAVSERVRESMWRSARRNTAVLTHGVLPGPTSDTSRTRAEIRTELGLAEDEVVGVTVANLRREKDYPNLLRAAALLKDTLPGLRLLAIGQGPLEAEVRALHRELALGDRVRLLGYRGDVADLLQASDFFVLASRHEGLPVALMEALALGLPVVATAVGGVPEAVTDGVEGLLVPHSDPTALAEAIRRLAHTEALRSRLSAAAARRGSAFDIRRTVAALELRYVELLDRREHWASGREGIDL